MADKLIIAVAGFFFAMGAVALARPERVLALFGTPSLTSDGGNEVSAVYGGFGVSIGCLLLATLWLPSIRTGVTVAVAVALLGMAFGRVIGALLEVSPGFFPWFFFGIEVVLALALVISLQLVG